MLYKEWSFITFFINCGKRMPPPIITFFLETTRKHIAILFIILFIKHLNTSSFIAFTLAGFMGAMDGSRIVAILVPFFLIIPLFALGSVGSTLVSLALKIVITGYTSNLVEETVWERCPKCGDRITKEELFCNKCGNQLRKKCPKCDFINEPSNNYCVKCGEKL